MFIDLSDQEFEDIVAAIDDSLANWYRIRKTADEDPDARRLAESPALRAEAERMKDIKDKLESAFYPIFYKLNNGSR